VGEGEGLGLRFEALEGCHDTTGSGAEFALGRHPGGPRQLLALDRIL
jgi:hypothetical protein